MSSFDARTTGRPDTWVIRRDGIEVGLLSFIPGAIALPQLHVDVAIRAWNHPPPPEPFACTHPRANRVYHPDTRAETCGRCGRDIP